MPVNAFWRDMLAALRSKQVPARGGGGREPWGELSVLKSCVPPRQPVFLSEHLGLAASSVSEVLLALAAIDLPFQARRPLPARC